MSSSFKVKRPKQSGDILDIHQDYVDSIVDKSDEPKLDGDNLFMHTQIEENPTMATSKLLNTSHDVSQSDLEKAAELMRD